MNSNVKNIMILGLMLFLLLCLVGCASMTYEVPKQPSFNQTYMPNTIPGKPINTVQLPKEVLEKVKVKRMWAEHYNKMRLYWTEGDNLILNIIDEEKISEKGYPVLYSFLIVPNNNEIKMLESAEKDAINENIMKSVSLVNTESKIAFWAKALFSYFTDNKIGNTIKFNGKVNKNGNIINFDINGTEETQKNYLGKENFVFIDFLATNTSTGERFKGRRLLNPDKNCFKQIYDFLDSVRVSPDGKYTIYESANVNSSILLTRYNERPKEDNIYDANTNTTTQLIYDYNYLDLELNPHWDKIALLTMKSEQDNVQFFVEIYPFHLPGSEHETISDKKMSGYNLLLNLNVNTPSHCFWECVNRIIVTVDNQNTEYQVKPFIKNHTYSFKVFDGPITQGTHKIKVSAYYDNTLQTGCGPSYEAGSFEKDILINENTQINLIDNISCGIIGRPKHEIKYQ